MTEGHAKTRDHRVLLLAPTRRDSATTRALLGEADIEVEVCSGFEALLHELDAGAGLLMVAEEALTATRNARLGNVLRSQPPWSDIPVLVLTRGGVNSADPAETARAIGNVTLLERPLRTTTLLSTVLAALRARERQYQIRGYLAERERAEQALRAADRRKDEFLATLGHELRNPLAPMLTSLHLLSAAGLPDSNLSHAVGVMQRQLSHLVRLVDDLLEVSRITRGVIEVKCEPLDLASILRGALDTSRPALQSGAHHVTVDLPDEPVTIAGDATRLTQVFANLLTNAAKYTDDGGRIWIEARQKGERVVVSVRDNGIGIPPGHLTSVFDMFTQVDRSSRRAQGGLGIGLTLVRSLVEMHKGRVEARSDGIGAGSEFIVELPVLTEGLPNADEYEGPAALPALRILVVDDNRDAAESLGVLLRALGATVKVAYSGREALDMLDRFDADAVLLDIGMPDMDGYDVARRIRQTPQRSGLLLIALTGWGQDEDFRRSRMAGFDHHLIKPPDIGELHKVLTQQGPPDARAGYGDRNSRRRSIRGAAF
jgi:two-component system, sensor histidine kinase